MEENSASLTNENFKGILHLYQTKQYTNIILITNELVFPLGDIPKYSYVLLNGCNALKKTTQKSQFLFLGLYVSFLR